jgi:hypothetical protein
MRDERALPDAAEQAVREAVMSQVEADQEYYLFEYARRFGNVLNADNAATLFAEYNEDPARYRVAVHPAAQWIRDALFTRVLAVSPQGKDRAVFTAGGNAAGKSLAISFSGATEHATAVVLDSTLSDPNHANKLIEQAVRAGKKVTILYVDRPLSEALIAVLDRARTEGRVVTLDQLIRSQCGAAETVVKLWYKFGASADFAFRFFDNAPEGFKEGTVALARPAAYTERRETLDGILDAEYQAGRIPEATWRRVKGRGEPAVRRP